MSFTHTTVAGITTITQTSGSDTEATLYAYMDTNSIGEVIYISSSVVEDPDQYILNFNTNTVFSQSNGATLNLGITNNLVSFILSGNKSAGDCVFAGELNLGVSQYKNNVKIVSIDSDGKVGASPSIIVFNSTFSGAWLGANLSSAGAIDMNTSGATLSTTNCKFNQLGSVAISNNVKLTLTSVDDTYQMPTYFRVRPTSITKPVINSTFNLNSKFRSDFDDSTEFVITNPNLIGSNGVGFFGIVSTVISNVDSFKKLIMVQSGNYQIGTNACRVVNQVTPTLTQEGVGKALKMYIKGVNDTNTSGNGKYYYWNGILRDGKSFADIASLTQSDITAYVTAGLLVEYLSGYDTIDTHFLTASSTGVVATTSVNLYVFWENNSRNPNYNSNTATGVKTNYRTFGGSSNPDIIQYWVGHTDIETKYITRSIYTNGSALSFSEDTIPDSELTDTETTITSYTEIDTSSKLYNYLKYIKWLSEDNLIAGSLLPDESICYRDGTELKIRSGWTITLSDTASNSYTDIDNKNLTIKSGTTFNGDKEIVFDKLVKDGVTLTGSLSYLNSSGETINIHHISSNVINTSLYFSIDILNNSTVLYSFDNLTGGSVDRYIEIKEGLATTIHTYGTGLNDTETNYTTTPINIPISLAIEDVNITATQIIAWTTKITNGEWSCSLTSSSISFSGTETLSSINSGVLYVLIDNEVRSHNNTNPTSRYDVDDYISVLGTTITLKKVVNSFNNLKITTGNATKLTLHDSNLTDLTTDFGIVVDTTTKFSAKVVNGSVGDVLGKSVNSVLTLETLTTTDDVIVVLNKADTNIFEVKSFAKITTGSKTITVNDNTYTVSTFNITGLDLNDLPTESVVSSDYLEVNSDKLVLKKSSVLVSDSSITKDLADIKLFSSFDLTYPFGVDEDHIINNITNGILHLNYDIETKDNDKYLISIQLQYNSNRVTTNIAFLTHSTIAFPELELIKNETDKISNLPNATYDRFNPDTIIPIQVVTGFNAKPKYKLDIKTKYSFKARAV